MPVPRWLATRGGLLRQHDFRHLWAADAASQFGTRISFLALPLAAVSYLHATTLEVSLLRTAQTIAYLLIGLQAGAWCDRMRKRPVVVAADLGRAALFAWVPIAALLGVLTVWQLYVVVGLAGVLTVFFDVARGSYLPHVVAAEDLVEANTKIAINQSVAAITAPVVAGVLVQAITAPITIAVDAASYLWSGLWLRGIRATDTPPERTEAPHLVREISHGLRFMFGDPILRAMSAHTAWLSLFQAANGALMTVFLVREVHLSPGVIGLLGTIGLIGALLASLITRRVVVRVGSARLLVCVSVTGGIGFVLDALTRPGWGLAFEIAGTFLASVMIIVMNIVETSYQQAVTPPGLQGRMRATTNFLVWGLIPVGSLLAGIAGTFFGLRPTLVACGVGALAGAGWLVFSPLRTLRDLPAARTDQTAPHPA